VDVEVDAAGFENFFALLRCQFANRVKKPVVGRVGLGEVVPGRWFFAPPAAAALLAGRI
jgi:hypothetical protein